MKNPPYFEGMTQNTEPKSNDIHGARVLALLGDSVTTDHISPAGSIAKRQSGRPVPAEQGVQPKDFNSYGSRRGNHEVMMRGTFANIRLRNQLAPGTEGGWTRHQPDGEQMTYLRCRHALPGRRARRWWSSPGKEYGTGSSRDWAAKGTCCWASKR